MKHVWKSVAMILLLACASTLSFAQTTAGIAESIVDETFDDIEDTVIGIGVAAIVTVVIILAVKDKKKEKQKTAALGATAQIQGHAQSRHRAVERKENFFQRATKKVSFSTSVGSRSSSTWRPQHHQPTIRHTPERRRGFNLDFSSKRRGNSFFN